MNTKLNVKQWAIASVVVFVITVVFAVIQNRLILPSPPSMTPDLQTMTPPDDGTGRILIYLSRLIGAALFTFIFTKGYEGKPGFGEGLRYGFWIGLLLLLPGYMVGWEYSGMTFGTGFLAFLVGMIQNLLCGVAVAQLYKPAKS
jgi:hypothetical protein